MNQKKPATLKSYGRAFHAISMSSAADARIREALDAKAPPTRRWLALAWAAPLAAACGLLAFWLTRPAPAPTAAPGCEVVRESTDTRYTGRCDVDLTAMTVRLASDATLVQRVGSAPRVGSVHRASTVSLTSGTAEFRVRKVPVGQPPVEIHVPEASIVVLGTEFTVTVTDHTSRVHLREGRVRFVHQGHGAIEMWPGQELTFETKTGKTEVVTVRTQTDNPASTASPAHHVEPVPHAADTPAQTSDTSSNTPNSAPSSATKHRHRAPQSAPTTGRPNAPVAPPSDLQVALELRAQGRYDEALERLGNVNPQDAHAREVVDFEQATLVELQAPERACRRYRQHLARFPNSRYRAATLQKLARCASSNATTEPPTGEASGEGSP